MSDFTNQQPRDTYPAILSLESNLISSSFKTVQDSKGNATGLALTSTAVKSLGKLYITTADTTTTELWSLMRDQTTGEVYQQQLTIAAGDVPSARTITINGTAGEIEVTGGTQDLSVDRSWTVGLPDDVTITSSLTTADLTATGTVTFSGITIGTTETRALFLGAGDAVKYRTLGTYAFLSNVDLGDLGDVDLTGLADGYGILYNSGTGNWEASAISGGGTTFLALSDTPGAYAGSAGYFVRVNGTPDALDFVSGIGISDLTATGTPSATTFLRGDNTWAVPAGGSADGYIGDATNPGGDAWHTAGAELRMTTLPIYFGGSRSANISLPVDDWLFEMPAGQATIFQAGSDTFLTMEQNVGTKIYHDDTTLGNNLALETFTSGTQAGTKIYGQLWIYDSSGLSVEEPGISLFYDTAIASSNDRGTVQFKTGTGGTYTSYGAVGLLSTSSNDLYVKSLSTSKLLLQSTGADIEMTALGVDSDINITPGTSTGIAFIKANGSGKVWLQALSNADIELDTFYGNGDIIFNGDAGSTGDIIFKLNTTTYHWPKTAGTAGSSVLKISSGGTDLEWGLPSLAGNFEITGHSYADAEVDDGNSSTADTIDWTTGNFHKSTMTGNCTYTFTAPTGPTTLILKLVQDGTGSRTATWPATVKWPSGTAPTLSTAASAVDIITFYWDGVSYYGTAVLNLS